MYKEFLTDLIAFPSTTPNSNGAIEYINNILTNNGFKSIIKPFGAKEYQVSNLYAVYGNSKPNICFAGHVDVVPAGDLSLWHADPFSAHVSNDKIYGRGAVDMKGAIACFLSASLDFIKSSSNFNGSISFLLTSDEEGEAKYGTQEMLKYLHRDKDNLIDFAIVGEPTNEEKIGDTVKIGRRGSINFTLTIYGVGGHVAYPSKANNPLPCLIEVIRELTHYTLDKGSEFFQKSALEITSIDVNNNSSNVIPSKGKVNFNIRFNDLHTSSSIIELIRQIIEKYTSKFNLQYELSEIISAENFIQQPVGYIADFIKLVSEVTKVNTKPSTNGGTSDARFIKNYCPVVEFGLRSNLAHKINEYAEISDLQQLYEVYYVFLRNFFK